MSISRDELVNILSVVSFLAHADREMQVSEKKVLIATFKAAGITPEEQQQMKSSTSLDGMLNHIQSDEAKHALIELMALVAGADGVFEDEERVVIQKIMKRIGIHAEHPYFDDNNLVDIPAVRANVGKILNSFKTSAHVEKETEQKQEATTNTVQEKIESDTKTEEEVSVEDSTRDESEAELDKGEVKAEPAQTQEGAEATSGDESEAELDKGEVKVEPAQTQEEDTSGQDDTVETNSEKNTND